MAKDFMAEDAAYVMHTYGRLPVEIVKGRGAKLFDSGGREYIDFLGGIGAVSLGHCHPKVAQALHEQIDKVWQTGNYFYAENRAELAHGISDLLSKRTDSEGHVTGSTGTLWQTFFANSGAEANEGAIKVARRWGERKLGGATGVLSAQRSFHGRTLATLAATGQDVFHESFLPMPEGFASVPLNDIAALEEAVENPPAACGPLCAVMLECIQGEGGVWPADPSYLVRARELTESRGLLLIIDEVQTGFFRTGAPFAFQLAGIEPDIVSLAKGIGDGFPMGAVAARRDVACLIGPGDHGSTFGGNPLAMAAGRATVEALVGEGIGEHVIAEGRHLAEGLAKLPLVTEVRGAGLMRGAQLSQPVAAEAVDAGLEAGLILNHIGDSILRFLPPLVVCAEEIDEMLGRLAGILGSYAS